MVMVRKRADGGPSAEMRNEDDGENRSGDDGSGEGQPSARGTRATGVVRQTWFLGSVAHRAQRTSQGGEMRQDVDPHEHEPDDEARLVDHDERSPAAGPVERK